MKQTIVTDDLMGDAPFRFGVFDAEHKFPCLPEEFFSSPDCLVHYTLGYVSILGESDTTKDLLQKYDSPSIHKDYTIMEFQVRYKDDLVGYWHDIQEQVMRPQLASFFGDVDSLIKSMRENHSVEVSTPKAAFRFAQEEEIPHANPQAS